MLILLEIDPENSGQHTAVGRQPPAEKWKCQLESIIPPLGRGPGRTSRRLSIPFRLTVSKRRKTNLHHSIMNRNNQRSARQILGINL